MHAGAPRRRRGRHLPHVVDVECIASDHAWTCGACCASSDAVPYSCDVNEEPGAAPPALKLLRTEPLPPSYARRFVSSLSTPYASLRSLNASAPPATPVCVSGCSVFAEKQPSAGASVCDA